MSRKIDPRQALGAFGTISLGGLLAACGSDSGSQSTSVATTSGDFTLGVLGRSEDAIAVYDELIARDGDRDEPSLSEVVARARQSRTEAATGLRDSQRVLQHDPRGSRTCCATRSPHGSYAVAPT